MKFKLAAFADEADGSLDGQISAMQKNGVDYLEIRGVDGENISDITADKARDIRARLDAAGISVWSLGSPFGKIGITEKFEPHLEKFNADLNLRVFSAPIICAFSASMFRKITQSVIRTR